MTLCGVIASNDTLVKHSGVRFTVSNRFVLALLNSRLAGVLFGPSSMVDLAGVWTLRPLPGTPVAVLVFVANLAIFDNGGVAVNAIFSTSSSSVSVKRSRSRRSHADVCLIKPGRGTDGNFFDVLNVDRTGLIGVVDDGVRNFDADTGATRAGLLLFGVFLVDIFEIERILVLVLFRCRFHRKLYFFYSIEWILIMQRCLRC